MDPTNFVVSITVYLSSFTSLTSICYRSERDLEYQLSKGLQEDAPLRNGREPQLRVAWAGFQDISFCGSSDNFATHLLALLALNTTGTPNDLYADKIIYEIWIRGRR